MIILPPFIRLLSPLSNGISAQMQPFNSALEQAILSAFLVAQFSCAPNRPLRVDLALQTGLPFQWVRSPADI